MASARPDAFALVDRLNDADEVVEAWTSSMMVVVNATSDRRLTCNEIDGSAW
jgi:hypothetical protein